MFKFTKETIVGVVGLGTGLIGIGYSLATWSKMAKVSERLDHSIDDLATNMDIDIPQDMIDKALEQAVALEAKKAVERATRDAMDTLKRDIHTTVSNAVEEEYKTIRDSVLDKTVQAAAKIDIARVTRDVERAAQEKALSTFQANLDGILNTFNENLNNTAKIYNSIASSVTRTGDREVVFKMA